MPLPGHTGPAHGDNPAQRMRPHPAWVNRHSEAGPEVPQAAHPLLPLQGSPFIPAADLGFLGCADQLCWGWMTPRCPSHLLLFTAAELMDSSQEWPNWEPSAQISLS